MSEQSRQSRNHPSVPLPTHPAVPCRGQPSEIRKPVKPPLAPLIFFPLHATHKILAVTEEEEGTQAFAR